MLLLSVYLPRCLMLLLSVYLPASRMSNAATIGVLTVGVLTHVTDV